MRRSFRRQPRVAGSPRPTDALTVATAPTGFTDAWEQLVGPTWQPEVPRRRGRTPRVPLRQLLPTLTFHVMQGAGTLAEHLRQLFDVNLADSSWSDRRTRLPWEIFADLMRRALRPHATRRRQREAFWRGWRLVAIDGTQYSLLNTPAITARTTKARTRRGRAAFAKMTTGVLLELGLHNPLAAAIGRQGESEWALAPQLLAALPRRALLLGDRMYGVGAFVVHVLAACQQVGSHCLLRTRRDIKPQVIDRLADGSRRIRVAVRQPDRPARIRQWVDLREIRALVGRPGHRAHELRLWTTLMDVETAPARELVQLYAARWEHELYFRELKCQLRTTDVLQSHTVETAAQEIAALILASALLARERARAAAGHGPVLRVSFVKVLALVQPLWLMLGVFGHFVSDRQKTQMATWVYQQLGECLTAPRRARSCPRAVRQPMQQWPRVLRPQAVKGPVQFEIV